MIILHWLWTKLTGGGWEPCVVCGKWWGEHQSAGSPPPLVSFYSGSTFYICCHKCWKKHDELKELGKLDHPRITAERCK